VSKKYKLAELSGYDSIDPIINADDVEEAIYEKVITEKKYTTMLEMLEALDTNEKIAIFMQVVRSVEWMMGESELMKDLIEEALDEALDRFTDSSDEEVEG